MIFQVVGGVVEVEHQLPGLGPFSSTKVQRSPLMMMIIKQLYILKLNIFILVI